MTLPSSSQKSLPQRLYLKVAVPVPVRRLFDYQMPQTPIWRGQRVRVPFGSRQLLGIAIASSDHTELDISRLRPVGEVLDSALISEAMLDLLLWAADYYQHPAGEVVMLGLPPLLRHRKELSQKPSMLAQCWRLSSDAPLAEQIKGAPKQRMVVATLARSADPVLGHKLGVSPAILKALLNKNWIAPTQEISSDPTPPAEQPLSLNQEQAVALKAIGNAVGAFRCLLLEGVTGSGKTEVYLQAIADCLKRGYQALVLVPEIGLTPQLRRRFESRFPNQVEVIHSGIPESARCNIWLKAADGRLPILLGTRAALFTPMPKLGLIIVDEEHDTSYKQREGFRYSARDLSIKYADQLDIPVVLGSATPSLESIANVKLKGYHHLRLFERTQGAVQPNWQLLDLRHLPKDQPLADFTTQTMSKHLIAGGQVLFFINRRGVAPVLMCGDCGWSYVCNFCDAYLVLHRTPFGLRMLCHHCNHQAQVPKECGSCRQTNLLEIGAGVQKFEATLKAQFPDYEVLRIDSDIGPVKRTEIFNQVRAGKQQILVGTNMLTKGHDFPNLTLTVIANADAGLFSADFRSPERIAQVITQVAGRAGRVLPGQVIIQTRHPQHPLLQKLLHEGYSAFAQQNLQERWEDGLPPYTYLAIFRSEAKVDRVAREFLLQIASHLKRNIDQFPGFELWGPVAPALARKAGWFYQHLVLCARQRSRLQQAVRFLIDQIEAKKLGHQKVRWSVELDPMEVY